MPSDINMITPGLPKIPTDSLPGAKPRQDPPINTITNTKELKQAELQGDHITVSDEQLVKAIEKAVKSIQGPYTYLEFSVHEKTRQIAVSVHNRETGEVIREIPPEKTLDFVAKLWEMAGILIDERR
jgi:flagellar protein FlaG